MIAEERKKIEECWLVREEETKETNRKKVKEEWKYEMECTMKEKKYSSTEIVQAVRK